jgi:hypothetical protein
MKYARSDVDNIDLSSVASGDNVRAAMDVLPAAV